MLPAGPVLNRRHLWLALAITCTAAHVISRTGVIHVPFDLYVRCIMAFSVGGCFYLYRAEIPWKRNLALAALVLLGILLFFKPTAEPALCILWGYAVLHYAKAGTGLLAFNRLPDVSYGIYLYAWPINKMLLWHFPDMNVHAAMVAVFALSVLAGTASWYLVEKPCMKAKALFRRHHALA